MLGLLVSCSGCGGRQSLEEVIEEAAEWPGARRSSLDDLQDEVQHVLDTTGTAADLNDTPIPPRDNAAIDLLTLFPQSEETERKKKAIEECLDNLNDEQLVAWYRTAGAFLRENFDSLREVKRLAKFRQCQFPVDFRKGYFSSQQFVDSTAMACRVQLIAAAEATSRESLDGAIEEWLLAWRWCDWLTAAPLVEAQLQAELLREDLFWILQLITTDVRISADQLRRLSAALERSLADWPSMEQTLVSERALVLHSYEVIREGGLEFVVTYEEKKTLRQNGVLEALRKGDEDQVDRDQLAYLIYMRQVIAISDKPFHMRASQLREFDRQLASSDEDYYAWLANRVFAEGLTRVQSSCARSHAATRGWWIAMKAAIGEPTTREITSDWNGESLAAEPWGNRMVVQLGDRGRSLNPEVLVPAAAGSL